MLAEARAMLDTIGFIIWGLLFIYVAFKFIRSVRIVPAQEVFIVERWGKYHKTLGAGFHLLIPFMDRVAYTHTLKEEAIDVPSQVCITRDNVQIRVDGVVYMRVIEPEKASDYRYALIQLAQTTMRSVFGLLDLDKTFEERDSINARIVQVVSEAAQPWGVQVLRYEIQNITPPKTVVESMEKQMTAERDKRAIIALSEGDKFSAINKSQGLKQELINKSEGEMQKRINEAEGEAAEIRAIALATAAGIRKIAEAVRAPGGAEAVRLTIARDYLEKVGSLGRKDTSVILPLNIANPGEILEQLETVIKKK
jgi:regulator of protease activity HflC (stomatin/prohibitin superfamily)